MKITIQVSILPIFAPCDVISLNFLLALHCACSTGAHACVTVLLSNGAKPNIVDNWQQTALFVAVEGGHVDCILKVTTSNYHLF